MIGTENEALSHAIRECATNGREWVIKTADGVTVWKIERDEKVDAEDLAFPVIVHMRGAMADWQTAILSEIVSEIEP